jgi:hypothetical protein
LHDEVAVGHGAEKTDRDVVKHRIVN